MDKLIMTPGPTECSEEVRRALAIKNTNTDMDKDFFELYENTCRKAKKLINSEKSTAIIMLGEAILGLESACASFIEEGDKVLCVDNGIFGRGFGDFIEMYGGEAVHFKGDYRKGIDIEDLERFIDEKGPFKLATLVHCETPTGVTNPIDKICPLLKNKGILSIVDAVSSYGGEEIHMDDWDIDVLLAGTQKCLSVTSGGTLLFLSDRAKEILINRKSSIRSYYANLKNWLNVIEEQKFPYTHSDAMINSINVALERTINRGDFVKAHRELAEKIRETFLSCGFNIYPQEYFSNTLTAIELPEGISFDDMFNYLNREKNIVIGGSVGEFKGKLFRVGHMGENAKEEKIYILLKALDEYFESIKISLDKKLHIEFSKK
ncbi:alanine--glyoxylate aminotransferase family protein [Clostridium sp. D2Q-11]|uniref:Alanine--glyoxylate aminotransferase family protein n=1 Tax=Anaeromonas frigoriresistens TaxID=2683708 RepID=A0A942UZ86_9FIRM|nr:alanine--glyoxylate aminotransferase family protein [Anaeromonas frigoriresistens]MBS4539026.1 alanine--glyoxylate aminotransferase family protein [Anaeromonas frigoriresistens]